MRPRALAEAIRNFAQHRVNEDRPRHGTVTSITNRDTTGEIECTLADGRTLYCDAGGVTEIAVGDDIWVRPLNLGARSQWIFSHYYASAGGSHVAGLRGATADNLLDRVLKDDDGNPLLDDDDNWLTEDA